MKRPLLYGCICLIAFIAIWTCCFDAPPFYSDISVKDGEQILITGQLYQKEYRSYYGTDQTCLYLKSIQIIQSGTDQVLKMNSKYKIICEKERSEEEPGLGQMLCIAGTWQEFEHATNPGEFDFADYYGSQNIVGKLKKCTITAQTGECWMVREFMFGLQEILQERLYKALPQKEASILAKMLLGASSGLDKEVKELYQRNGIVHILSISGLHITMIGMGIYRLLRKCSCPIIPAAVVGVFFLLLYGCMTGFGISAVRAIGMYLVHMLGEVSGRSYDLLTAAGLLMVIMLADNHRLVYHCGFLLSFASVAAVGCLYPILPLQETAFKKRAVPPPVIVRWIIRRFGGMLQALWASAAVSIVTLPIMLFYFYEIPVYSPFVNLLVLPFMGVVMVLGMILMVFPGGSFLAGLEHIILNGYEKLCLLFEELPGHTWLTGRPQFWQIAVYYGGILLLIWLCNRKNRWWSMGIAVFVLFLGTDFQKETEVAFLDVGQGDCILIMAENGRTYLFDGGSSTRKNTGENIIEPFLKYHGRDVLDGVFISHPDTDHISGILELLEQDLVEIRAIYLPDVAEECRADFREILEYAAEEPVIYYSEGDCLQTGGLQLRCLHPEKGILADTNVYSGCFLIEFEGVRILLTGDVEAQGEVLLTRTLEKQEIDKIHVLKVAHHGSKYSTADAFLKQTAPALAVISCGQDNTYGHPHEELLERLEDYTDKVYITKDSGAVVVIPEEGKVKIRR